MPFVFIGGAISLPGHLYKPVVGLVLLYSAYRLVAGKGINTEVKHPPLMPVAASGAGIGLLSGLTGVVGGIFLSPLLLFAGWADMRQASGVAAAFILLSADHAHIERTRAARIAVHRPVSKACRAHPAAARGGPRGGGPQFAQLRRRVRFDGRCRVKTAYGEQIVLAPGGNFRADGATNDPHIRFNVVTSQNVRLSEYLVSRLCVRAPLAAPAHRTP